MFWIVTVVLVLAIGTAVWAGFMHSDEEHMKGIGLSIIALLAGCAILTLVYKSGSQMNAMYAAASKQDVQINVGVTSLSVHTVSPCRIDLSYTDEQVLVVPGSDRPISRASLTALCSP